MNKNLKDRINKLIEEKIVTANLCYLCLANLNEKIYYSNRSYSHLIEQRDTIAKTLISNGFEKLAIADKIRNIDKECYPTLNRQIKSVYEIILSKDYIFGTEQIPEHYIKYKSKEQLEYDKNRIKRNTKEKVEDKKLIEVITYLSNTFFDGKRIQEKHINRIKELNKEDVNYKYEVILFTVKSYKHEIESALWRNDVKENGKFEYILAIIRDKLPERIAYLNNRKEQEKNIYLYSAYAVYTGEMTLDERIDSFCKNGEYDKEYVKNNFVEALAELDKNEALRFKIKLEQEYINKPKVEYKPRVKTNKYKEKKFKDLW